MTTTYMPEVVELHKFQVDEGLTTKENENLDMWIKNKGPDLFSDNQQNLYICMIPIRNEYFSCPKKFAVCFKDTDWYQKLKKSLCTKTATCIRITTLGGTEISNFTRNDIERSGCFFAKYTSENDCNGPIVVPPIYDSECQSEIIRWFYEIKKKSISLLAKKITDIERPIEMLEFIKNIQSNFKECINETSKFKVNHPFDKKHSEIFITVNSFNKKVNALRNSIFVHHPWTYEYTKSHTKTFIMKEFVSHLKGWTKTIKDKYKQFCLATKNLDSHDKNTKFNFFYGTLRTHFNNHKFMHTDHVLKGLLGIKRDESFGLVPEEDDYIPNNLKNKKKYTNMDLFALINSENCADVDRNNKRDVAKSSGYTKTIKPNNDVLWGKVNELKALKLILSDGKLSKMLNKILMTSLTNKRPFKLIVPGNELMKNYGPNSSETCKMHLNNYLRIASSMVNQDGGCHKKKFSGLKTDFKNLDNSIEINENDINGVKIGKIMKTPGGYGTFIVIKSRLPMICRSKKCKTIVRKLTPQILREGIRISKFVGMMDTVIPSRGSTRGIIEKITKFDMIYIYAPTNEAIEHYQMRRRIDDLPQFVKVHLSSQKNNNVLDEHIVDIYSFNNAKLFIINKVLAF